MGGPTDARPGARPAVLATRRFPGPALDRLGSASDLTVHPGPGPIPRDRLLREVRGKAGVVVAMTERVDAELLTAAGEGLAVVANYGVGYDHIDVEACTRRGVMVTNTPDVLTEATADLTWALLLAAARRVGEGERFLRAGGPWVWEPDFLLGRDVHGRVLGVVGFGRIGRAVARRALGFDMTVRYHSRTRAPTEVERRLAAGYRPLDDLVAEADYLTVHVSLTPETHHLIDAARLSRMKPTAVLVNASRGPVVDEAALVAALREGRIRAAALDVFEREPEVHPGLRELENVVIVPHLGSATVEARTAMTALAVDNVLAALEGRRPPNLVNPQAWEPRAGAGG
jgi:glyoxylate reductase